MGFSCLNFDNYQPEVVSDVIPGVVVDPTGVKVAWTSTPTLFYSHTGYDVTSFRSAFIEVRNTAENVASGGFGSNFGGAAFCLIHQLVGILLGQNAATAFCPVVIGSVGRRRCRRRCSR